MKPNSDLLILAALRSRERYRVLRGSVPTDSLGVDCQWLLKWFPSYWAAYPEHTELDPQALLALIRLRGKLDDDQLAIARAYCDKLAIEISPDTVAGVVQQLSERTFAGEASRLIMDYQAGGEVDLIHELNRLSTGAAEVLSKGMPSEFYAGDDIFGILEEQDAGHGLQLKFMQGFADTLRPFMPGDTLLFGAPPDGGKTSLVAAAIADWAPQVANLYGDRPILWLNNEGSAKRILPRVYSAALHATYEDLVQFSNDGVLLDKYSAVVHGANRVRIKDAHGFSIAQIDRVVQSMKPAIVVFDMMANFRLGGKADMKNHDKVEGLWQEVREMAVRHEFLAVGTSQLSVDGHGIPYPPLNALKDSKVGVQGAIDVAILMGDRRDVPELEHTRWFSAPKNKRKPTGVPGMRFEAYFDKDRCTFSDGGTV